MFGLSRPHLAKVKERNLKLDFESAVARGLAGCALTGSLLKGVVLLLLGALLISTVDNLLRPVLVGKDAKMPSYLVLVSSLGGIGVFGVNGVVIGPLVAALFLASWRLHFEAIESQTGCGAR